MLCTWEEGLGFLLASGRGFIVAFDSIDTYGFLFPSMERENGLSFVRPDGGGPVAGQGRSLDDSTTISYFLDFGALLECP